MFSRLRDFATRHRRKFIVTGVLVGGTYVAIKYAQRKLIEYQTRQAREFFEKTKRMQHFETTEHTCNKVIIGMGTELYAAIIRECNTNALLDQLRQNPPNKLELWEEMKIVAFTRLTTFIYASSMLVIALRVQMNLLGGYLYQDVTLERKQILEELKQQYLSLIGYFIHDGGLSELIRIIRAKVLVVMKTLPLSKRFSLSDIEQLFWTLQMAINSDAGDPIAKMATYLLPPQVPEYNTVGPLLQKMYNETLDLLESDDAASVCSNSICRGFSLTVDAIAESIGDTLTQAQKATANEENKTTQKGDGGDVATSNSVLSINSVEMALAKLIPIVSGLTSQGFDEKSRPQNLATSLITFYMVDEKSKVFGANVYETFSST
ncbi:peroxisomal biogenesis factor 3 [Bactrocera neohumeralis]|uniref:peroxisomal biogenesis factor 3 n=1 Tax=Bactrocera tryoni TaxID=59916 RepID=UPI001A983FF5|nr:peroxisomal biogenesis factor 3 [Bactrocera tryoni]XP_039963836.1 peroxisomal biogenesis factor 3 [Bactrocera tryoni]XP_050333203.1 peroxisomal biogenesis factor 3 [Bactrocera neohumeralis]XP_050333205.1 peroxisomal biogenesis factor 3 [Bactrocera neohumeralis]